MATHTCVLNGDWPTYHETNAYKYDDAHCKCGRCPNNCCWTFNLNTIIWSRKCDDAFAFHEQDPKKHNNMKYIAFPSFKKALYGQLHNFPWVKKHQLTIFLLPPSPTGLDWTQNQNSCNSTQLPH